MIHVIIKIIIIFIILNGLLPTFYYLELSVLLLLGIFYSKCGNSKKIQWQPSRQAVATLNEHNCFITLICLKHFSMPRKDLYIFLLNVYFVQIKNEHENIHFNYFWFQIYHADNVMRIFYKLAVTMQDNVILFT